MAQFLAEIKDLFELISENRKHLKQSGANKDKAKIKKTIIKKGKAIYQRRKIVSVATTKA